MGFREKREFCALIQTGRRVNGTPPSWCRVIKVYSNLFSLDSRLSPCLFPFGDFFRGHHEHQIRCSAIVLRYADGLPI